MSVQIDERVVKLVFEPGNFKTKAQEVLDILGIIKKETGMYDASSMEGLAKDLDLIAGKFTVLGAAAFNVLTGIAEEAVRTGAQLVKSLTIDNVIAGYSKYVAKTQSIQTIMAATGKSIEEVNSQIARLNWFTDETSYNLTDMTSNIAKFTSNGVELDTAVTAMMGIASAAGLAGAGVQSASHAMEGFSKAIAANRLTLKDWQWIKTARMDTMQFKQQIIEAAVAEGTLTKAINAAGETIYQTAKGTEVSYSKFDLTLSEGWANKEVLLKALQEYGSFAVELNKIVDETGATATEWLSAIEDFTSGAKTTAQIASELGVSSTVTAKALERLSAAEFDTGQKAFRMSQEAKSLQETIDAVRDAASTRWMTVFEDIIGNYEEAKVMWTQLSEYLYDVFVAPLDAVVEAFDLWKAKGGRDMLLSAFENIGPAVERVFTPIKQAFTDVFGDIDIYKKISELTVSFYNFVQKCIVGDEVLNKLRITFRGVFNALGIFIDAIKNVKIILKPLLPLARDLAIILLNVASYAGNLVTALRQAFSASKFFQNIATSIAVFISAIRNSFFNMQILNSILKLTSSAATAAFKLITSAGLLMANLIRKMAVSLAPVVQRIGVIFQSLGTGITNILNGVLNAATSIANVINSILGNTISTLKQFSMERFIAGIYGFIAMIKTVNWVSLGIAFKNGLKNFVEGLNEIKFYFEADYIKSLAISIGILAASLALLSTIPEDRLITAGLTLIVLGAALAQFYKAVDIAVSTEAIKRTAQTLMLAATMPVLASSFVAVALAMAIIGSIDTTKLPAAAVVMGIIGVVLMGMVSAMTAFASAVTKMRASMKTMAMMQALSRIAAVYKSIGMSLVLAAAALYIISTIDTNTVWRALGITAILAGILTGMAVFLKTIPAKQMAINALAMTIMTASLVALAVGFMALGLLPYESINKGILCLGAIVIAIGMLSLISSIGLPAVAVGVAAFAVMAASLIGIAVGLGILGTSLSIISGLAFGPLFKFVGWLSLAAVVFSLLGIVSPFLMLFAAGINILGKGLLNLGKAMAVFVAISQISSLIGMFTQLAVGLLVFSLITSLCAVLTPLLIIFAAGLAVMAAALAVAAPAILAFASAWAFLKNVIRGGQEIGTMVDQVTDAKTMVMDLANESTSAANELDGVAASLTDLGNTDLSFDDNSSAALTSLADSFTDVDLFKDVGIENGAAMLEGLNATISAGGDYSSIGNPFEGTIEDYSNSIDEEEVVEAVAAPFESSAIHERVEASAEGAAKDWNTTFSKKMGEMHFTPPKETYGGGKKGAEEFVESFWKTVEEAGFERDILAQVIDDDQMDKLIADFVVYGKEAFIAAGKLDKLTGAYNNWIAAQNQKEEKKDADASNQILNETARENLEEDIRKTNEWNSYLGDLGITANELKTVVGDDAFGEIFEDFFHYNEAGQLETFTGQMQDYIDKVDEMRTRAEELGKLEARLTESDAGFTSMGEKIQSGLDTIKQSIAAEETTFKDSGDKLAGATNSGVAGGSLSGGAKTLSSTGLTTLEAQRMLWRAKGNSLGQEALREALRIVQGGAIAPPSGGGHPDENGAPQLANTSAMLGSVASSANSAGSAIGVARRKLRGFRLPKNLEGFDGNLEITITPVIDMSVMDRQVREFGKGITAEISAAAAKSVRTSSGADAQNAGKIINLNYTQNNTSPKALSQYEIYRQTQNQLTRLRRTL